jgi:hypothetical protein
MNARERISAALQHREPDRTPVFEYVLLAPMASRLLGRPCATDPGHWARLLREIGWEQSVRRLASDQLDLALLLGHDMMYVVPNPPPPTPAKEGPPRRWSADPAERLHIRNERAAAAPPPPEETLQVYACLKDEMRRRDADLPILAPAYVHGIWTDVDLMEALILAPEAAHEHFALATRQALALVDRYTALGLDQIGVGGDFSGTRPLISPAAYRDFIVPEVRRLTRHIHAANRIAVQASDGNLWPVLDDFLFGCEADGYLEIDLHAGMDMARLKAVTRGRVTLYGNLDCGITLSFGTPDEVAAHVTRCLEAGLGGGGHILCASNAITDSIPLENYVAAVNAYRDMFNLPKFTPV